MNRRRWLYGTGLALAGLSLPLLAQDPPATEPPAAPGQGFNERQVEKTKNPEDAAGIWMLDFHFKDPRPITVDIPGRGRRVVWYLWYQVINNTGAPRKFEPTFVWVSQDTDKVAYDQILPKAQMAVQRLEDGDNIFDMKNSVTIGKEPIPVNKQFNEKGEVVAFPKAVTGVALWDGVDPKSTQFSIFVYGLSDGFTIVDGPGGKPIMRRKALQLKFKRLGDEFTQKAGQIRYMGHEWVYATLDVPVPVLGEPPPKGKPGETPPGQDRDKP